jgi:peptidoglycan-associated lipoprotein
MTRALLIATAALLFGFAMTASCGDKPKAPGCKGDKDCKNGQVCGDNKCVECNDDSQCKKGARCSAHACIAAPQCTKDEQCPSGEVCQAGKCKACSSDNECGPGGSCKAGSCTKGKKCSADKDCADDEDCTNGFCQKQNHNGNQSGLCTLPTVYFGYDDSGIQASERDRLDAGAQCIEKTKGRQVLLFGHTDSSGTEEYNIALSERRAQAVADYLSRLGTDPARMNVVPKGETEPTGQGDDKDRRVEMQWK